MRSQDNRSPACQPIGVREAPCKRSALPYCPVNREPVPKHDIRVGRANQDYEHAFFKRHFDLSALRSLEKVRSASARGLPDSPRRMAAGTKATVWRRRRPWFWRMCGPGGFDRCYPGARHRGSLVQISWPARFAGHGADGPRRGSGADAHVGEPSSLHSRGSSPVLAKPFRVLVTVKVPSLSAVTLIQWAGPLWAGGGALGPGCGAVIAATGIAAEGSSSRLAMNIPGTVYSWPLSWEKCICHKSSRPGEECSTCIESASPPLRVPLFMMPTRGWVAWLPTHGSGPVLWLS